MSDKQLTRLEADLVAAYLIQCNDSHTEAYKLYNPQWATLKKQTRYNYAYRLFNQPIVKSSIIDVHSALLERIMAKAQMNMESQLNKLEVIAAQAMEAKQYSAAVSAVKDQNSLLKLYDQISDDAVKLDMIVARPNKKLSNDTTLGLDDQS
jgi:hypothetical protein